MFLECSTVEQFIVEKLKSIWEKQDKGDQGYK